MFRIQKIFYGYWVLFAGTMVMMLLGIAGLHGLGVFFSALQRDYNWSSGLLSGAFALSRAESSFLGPIEGFLVDKFGTRKMVILGMSIMVFGFLLLSTVDGITDFYIALVVIALGTGLGGFLPIMAALTNWFNRFRARAMALATLGVNVGGLLVVVLTWSVDNYGWRTSAIGFGVFVLVLILPIGKILRNQPEDMRLKPDGDIENGVSSGDDINSSVQNVPDTQPGDMTVNEALRSQAFWLLSLVHGIAVMGLSALAVHQIERMVVAGVSLQMAGLVVSIYTGLGIFFRLLSGYVADKFDKRYVIAIFLLFQTAALFVFAQGETITMFVVFGLLFAPGWSGRGAALTALRGELFGRKRFASITGMSMVITNSLALIGPIFTGVMYDATDSYGPPFLVLSGLSLVAAVLVLFVRNARLRTRN
ncbi:MAG: MFS transporter [SAR202 cluster bacterium]|nr:MFS transporter [SAR202 cluster bacterium]|tara:strand:+ start:2908 stop:4170 length:1263 start_codon:yes stop_codon:yes gene_type:complete